MWGARPRWARRSPKSHRDPGRDGDQATLRQRHTESSTDRRSGHKEWAAPSVTSTFAEKETTDSSRHLQVESQSRIRVPSHNVTGCKPGPGEGTGSVGVPHRRVPGAGGMGVMGGPGVPHRRGGGGGDEQHWGPPSPCPQTPPTRPLGQLLRQGTSLQRLEPLPHVLSRSLRGFSWLDGASFFLVFIDFPSSDGARCVSPSPGHLGCFMFGNVNNASVKVVDTFFCAD